MLGAASMLLVSSLAAIMTRSLSLLDCIERVFSSENKRGGGEDGHGARKRKAEETTYWRPFKKKHLYVMEALAARLQGKTTRYYDSLAASSAVVVDEEAEASSCVEI